MAYKFMLGALPLPIPPSSLSISTPSTNQTLTLINDGEINIPKPPGLREISFEFLLPTFQKYPFEDYRIGNYTVAIFIEYIKAWKWSHYPIPFIVVRMSPAGKFLYFTSILCLIEDFTFDEDAEDLGFDTKCSIKLKEYVFYGTRRAEIKEEDVDGKKTATIKNQRSTADRVKKTEIKPKEGESIISAAKREGYEINDISQMKYNPETAGDMSPIDYLENYGEIKLNNQDMMYGGSGYDPSFSGIKVNTNSDRFSLIDITPSQKSILETIANQESMKVVPIVSENPTGLEALVNPETALRQVVDYITIPGSAAKDVGEYAAKKWIGN